MAPKNGDSLVKGSQVLSFLEDLQGSGLAAMSCPTLGDPIGLVAFQASLFKGFSMQEYWNGLPFPSPGDLPHPMGLLHCRRVLYQLSFQGSSKDLQRGP